MSKPACPCVCPKLVYRRRSRCWAAASGGDAKLALDALSILTTKFKGTSPELAGDTLKLLGDADLTPGRAITLRAKVDACLVLPDEETTKEPP